MSALSLPLRRAALWLLPLLGRAPALLLDRTRSLGRERLLLACALATVYLVWGSTYLALDVAIRAVPPFLLLAVRFLFAGAGLLVIARLRDGAIAPFRWPLWRHAAGTAASLLVAGTGLTALAQTRLTSGTAALLASTVPLWLALFARGMFGERLTLRAWLGSALGLVGVAVLVDPAGGGDLLGMLLVLLAAAAWARGSLRSRSHVAPAAAPMVLVALEMLVSVPMFALVGLALGEHRAFEPAAVGLGTIVSLGYLVVAGSVVAFTAYRWLLRHASTTLVGTYAYVNPVVAVVLGWLVLAEPVDGRLLAGGGVILVSVMLLVTGRPGEPVPAQPTSGVDVFAEPGRWHRVRTSIGRLPRVGRLYVDPHAPPYRDVGYDTLDASVRDDA